MQLSTLPRNCSVPSSGRQRLLELFELAIQSRIGLVRAGQVTEQRRQLQLAKSKLRGLAPKAIKVELGQIHERQQVIQSELSVARSEREKWQSELEVVKRRNERRPTLVTEPAASYNRQMDSEDYAKCVRHIEFNANREEELEAESRALSDRLAELSEEALRVDP